MKITLNKENAEKLGLKENQEIKILNEAIKRFELGPGVIASLMETSNGEGFDVIIKGTFRSGSDLYDTMTILKRAWEQVDIDA